MLEVLDDQVKKTNNEQDSAFQVNLFSTAVLFLLLNLSFYLGWEPFDAPRKFEDSKSCNR